MTARLMILLCASVAYSSIALAQTSPAPRQNNQTGVIKAEDCGCEAQVLPEILAIVNGVRITASDINRPTAERVNSLQQQIVEARKAELDLLINSKLLDTEAKKRQVTTTKLMEEEIIAKAKEPTEAEVQSFYDQNKGSINDEFKNVKTSIVTYLRERRQREEAQKFADRLRAAASVKKLVMNVTPPATAADRAQVLATVNGDHITSNDVENSLRASIVKVQEQVYNIRKEELDLRINDVLLEQEAQKRKITTRVLLESATSNLKQVTEADARTFYEQYKERIRGDFAQTKNQIIEYLKEREKKASLTAFTEQLRRTASVQTFLNSPK